MSEIKRQAFSIGNNPTEQGLLPLTALAEHEPIVLGVHRVQIRVAAIHAGDQTVVGNSNTLAVSLAGAGTREITAAQLQVAEASRDSTQFPALSAIFSVDATPCPVALAMVLDRGVKPETIDTIVRGILADTDLLRETQNIVTSVVPKEVGFLGGLASAAALWFVERLVDTVSDAIFGQHVLLAEKISLAYDDDSSLTRAHLGFGNLPLFEDINVGEPYTLEDFGVDPDSGRLIWNKKSHPRRGWQVAPYPFARVEIVSHR